MGAFGGKVLVFGGRSLEVNLAEAECFDPESNAWSELPRMLSARNRCAAGASGGRIYIFGGSSDGQDTASLDRYDPMTGGWEALDPMERPRGHCMVVAVTP